MIDEKKLIDELKQSGMIADNSYGNAMVDFINSQPKIGQWIPCSERLPEVNVRVLTTHENGIVQMAYLSDNGNFVIKDDGDLYVISVVAWQPLPEPYKEKR